jgi:hypothetical protein
MCGSYECLAALFRSVGGLSLPPAVTLQLVILDQLLSVLPTSFRLMHLLDYNPKADSAPSCYQMNVGTSI